MRLHSRVFDVVGLQAGVLAAAVVFGGCDGVEERPPDSGATDSGATDSGIPDSGTSDSGIPDSGTPSAAHEVWLQGANGYGTTNTAIRRFTNVVRSSGSDLTLARSETDGDSVVVNRDGIYSVYFAEVYAVADGFGVSVSSTQLSSALYTIAPSTILVEATAGADQAVASASSVVYLRAGDVLRPHGGAPGTATGARPELAAFRVVRVGDAPAAVSEVWLQGANEHGTTHTAIRRFSNVVRSTGSDLTLAQSATDGDSVLVNSDGIYGVYFAEAYAAAEGFGISVNSTQLSNALYTIAPSNILAETTGGAGGAVASASAVVHLRAGDVVRPHGGAPGTATGSRPELAAFRVLRVADAPAAISEVWVHGANGYGTTHTAIRRLTNVVQSTGSDITLVQSATDGDSVQVHHDGVYAVYFAEVYATAEGFGISVSSTQLSSALYTIAPSSILAEATAGASQAVVSASAVVYLRAGDVVRPHGGPPGTATGARSELVTFRVIGVR